jgi:outer membrane protein OmpA-like peptidoglycan-associated protein
MYIYLKPLINFLVAVLFFGILTGCATSRDHIVLLPNKDGTPSELVVKTNKGEYVLDKPYATANVMDDGGIKPAIENETTIKTNYGEVLSAQPMRPVSYMLYFVSGTDELTADSKVMLEVIKTELKARPAPEITAIGHTSTKGRPVDNDALSLERATTMRRVLVEAGISGNHFTIAGHGERELLIPTPDGVDEPRNRRVEINVR